MKKSIVWCVLIMVMTVLPWSPGGSAWAGPPAIQIDLVFDKASYAFDEPVGMEVTVSNQSGGDITISEGFSSADYYLQMRVIDPAGRLLIVHSPEPGAGSGDAPPLPWVFSEGKFIQVIGCEVLAAGWTKVSRTDDLRLYYTMDLPGYYSAQVQLFAKTFDGAPCDVRGYTWKGSLKSETKYFYIQGDTRGFRVVPDQWKTSWADEGSKDRDIQVQIWPDEGETAGDYDPESIRLNNVPARRVQVLHPMVKAFFSSRDAITSLGTVAVGETRRVMISGFKKGTPFGGEVEITVVK
jgi:hypothetical protein